MSSIPIHEPSLSSRAMLCAPSIAQWSASKHDRQAADEIEARQEHYFMTLPWDDNGYRVLPAAVYMEHTEKLREYTRQFRAAVEAFVFQSFKLTGGAQLWEERLPKHASSAGLERNCFIAGVL